MRYIFVDFEMNLVSEKFPEIKISVKFNSFIIMESFRNIYSPIV